MKVRYSRSNKTFEGIVVRIMALATAGIGVAGCTMVGPDCETREAAVSEAWSDAADPALMTESEEHREWWKNFNDPALDTLIQTAYAQNLSLQIAGPRVHEARAILEALNPLP